MTKLLVELHLIAFDRSLLPSVRLKAIKLLLQYAEDTK